MIERLSQFVPVRLQSTGSTREPEFIEIEGVTGHDVVLLIENDLQGLKFLAKILKAPKIVRRTMHSTVNALELRMEYVISKKYVKLWYHYITKTLLR